MAATDILIRGGNKLHEQQLYRDDGTTPLLLSELSLLQVSIIQYGRTLATYNFKPGIADGEIREGSTTSKVEIEITKELSATFREGLVQAKFIMEETDSDFVVDGVFYPPEFVDLFTVQ